jgi:hypothetical protein
MRFTARETVNSANQEMVLLVLERCLRDVSNEIIREPGQITFRGLGPISPSKNRNDTAVLVVSVKNDITVIDVDVRFQASAMLGDLDQDELVRSKLDQVFHQVKTHLAFDRSRDLPSPPAAETAALPEIPPTIETLVEKQIEVSSKPNAPEDLVALKSNSSPSDHTTMGDYPAVQGVKVWAARSRWLVALATIAASSLLVVSGRQLLLHDRKTSAGQTAVASRPFVTRDDSSPVRSDNSPLGTEKQIVVPPNPSAKSPTDTDDLDTWLQNWAAAMRTRDPVAQTSFYADPVAQYNREFNVSAEVMLKKKQAAIAERKRLWTIKLQNIVIDRPEDSVARVRLVKHLIDQSPSGKISERLVRTRFTLRRANGRWEITSERDIP